MEGKIVSPLEGSTFKKPALIKIKFFLGSLELGQVAFS